MDINILMQGSCTNTIWGKKIVDGITNKINALRYTAKFINETDIDSSIKLLIIVGDSLLWVSNMLHLSSAEGIRTIVINCQPDIYDGNIKSENTSFLINNYDASTKKCIDYLHGCGKHSIALYGANKNSYADLTKAKHFNFDNVFYCNEKNGLENCFNRFFRVYKQFDSVICSNYISAASLINRLIEQNVQIPKELYIISFGESMIGQLISPTVTTISLNYEALGEQAILIYKYLYNQSDDISITLTLSGKIICRETTDYNQFTYTTCPIIPEREEYPSFLQDDEIREIQSLEYMLKNCKPSDFKILSMLIDGRTTQEINTDTFVSESTRKYRIKKLREYSSTKTVDELVQLFKKYIKTTEALRRYYNV